MILHRKLDVSEYTIPYARLSPGSSVTLCHISDVHNNVYGDYSAQAVEAICARKPDILVCTGDIMDCRKDEPGRFFFSIIDRLPPMPVVLSPGNHEKRIERAEGRLAFAEHCRARGMYYLDGTSVTCTVRGQRVRFYGYLQPFYTFTKKGRTRARLRQNITAQELTATFGPCSQEEAVVLMAHDPALFEAYAGWGAPLTLSGHIHGGVVRLPLLGGVFSPARKLFPRYDAGLFTIGACRMIVSRGLVAPKVPRVFNRPEIAFITLTSSAQGGKEER